MRGIPEPESRAPAPDFRTTESESPCTPCTCVLPAPASCWPSTPARPRSSTGAPTSASTSPIWRSSAGQSRTPPSTSPSPPACSRRPPPAGAGGPACAATGTPTASPAWTSRRPCGWLPPSAGRRAHGGHHPPDPEAGLSVSSELTLHAGGLLELAHTLDQQRHRPVPARRTRHGAARWPRTPQNSWT